MKDTRTPAIHERLMEARACLERLALERSSRGDPRHGKALEERIIWRELLDLELQDADEQIERTCESTKGFPGARQKRAR